MATQTQFSSASVAGIFTRLLDAPEAISNVSARRFLKLKLNERDLEAMRKFFARNSEILLTESELQKLVNHLAVGDMLAILQSIARRKLEVNRRHSDVAIG